MEQQIQFNSIEDLLNYIQQHNNTINNVDNRIYQYIDPLYSDEVIDVEFRPKESSNEITSV